ncbi:MAG TPA: sigma-70 family RNA polymerase sigma factor [Polyangiaceae bacterium]|jgi:RNA polymerase sigma-70 factor (ECF subfamily)|nr:sigma-70 family RNA polymerase sigma factor [Polyangiaceae bacterium]
MTAPDLPEHWFRREFGRLVSILSHRFGVHRIELCEDAAQTALLQATRSWSSELPENPGAWLYRVAHNHVLDELRREKRDERYQVQVHVDYAEQEVHDDVLRLLFVCADPVIPPESQLVLALKTLCGFSIEEIALRLFQSEDAINKRLQRARARLREHAEVRSIDSERVHSVLHMLYLLFNEGYSSAQPDRLIRRELCDEAFRLALMLKEDPAGDRPETDALVALMCFHAARFDARVDEMGGLLLLEEQDRSLWNRELVERGLVHLTQSARGEQLSRYHAEAGIAAEHCLAPSYAETNWEEIVRLYEVLEHVAPSPLNLLNRAIAIAEWQGPDAALATLDTIDAPSWLLDYYLWDATLGELHRRRGDRERALLHTKRALASAPTNPERALLERRLKRISAEE